MSAREFCNLHWKCSILAWPFYTWAINLWHVAWKMCTRVTLVHLDNWADSPLKLLQASPLTSGWAAKRPNSTQTISSYSHIAPGQCVMVIFPLQVDSSRVSWNVYILWLEAFFFIATTTFTTSFRSLLFALIRSVLLRQTDVADTLLYWPVVQKIAVMMCFLLRNDLLCM